MIVVECGCGKSYTLEEFRELPYCGKVVHDDGEEPWAIEIRNCTCGSSRAINVNKDGTLYVGEEETL